MPAFNLISRSLQLAGISYGRYFTLVSLQSISALLDVAMIGLVTLLVVSIQQPSELPPVIISYGPSNSLSLAILLLTVFSARFAYAVVMQRWIFRFLASVQTNLIISLLTRYFQYDYSEFSEKDLASLINTTTRSVYIYINQNLGPLLRLPVDVLTIVLIALALFWVNITVTLLTTALFFIVGLVYLLFVQSRIGLLGKIFDEEQERILRHGTEALQNFENLTASDQADVPLALIKDAATKYTTAGASYYSLTIVPKYLLEGAFIGIFTLGLLLVAAGDGEITSYAPVAAAFAVAAMRMIPITTNILGGFSDLKFAQTSLNKLSHEMDSSNFSQRDVKYLTAKKIDNVYLDRISVRFNKSKSMILEDVSAKFSIGRLNVIVGPSGVGKSTLLRVLSGQVQPISGEVWVDHTLLKEMRVKAGVMSQASGIFSGSLLFNITYETSLRSVDKSRLKNAVLASNLDFINHEQDLSEIMLSADGGETFSGGQNQRVALARALYSCAPILLLDEPTSALDVERGNSVWSALKNEAERRLVVVVTHNQNFFDGSENVVRLGDEGAL